MKGIATRKAVYLILLTAVSSILLQLLVRHQTSVIALSPNFDIPEEVLRTEVIIQGRSPIDGKPLTPAEYAQLEAQLKTRLYPPKLSSQVRDTVFLLRIRKLLNTLFPFVNF